MDTHRGRAAETALVWHGGSKLYSLDERRWKVLVAHSDDVTRVLVSTAFRRDGYKVTTCADGSEAYAQIARPGRACRNADRLAMIVVEVDLPRRTGVELLALLRRRGSLVPVVLLSPGPSPAARAAAFGASHACVFEGPFRRADLLTAAAMMLTPPRASCSDEGRGSAAPGAGLSRDRRVCRRVPVSLEVSERIGRLTAVQLCTNLSSAGLFIVSTISPGPGRAISRRFSLPGEGAAITSAGEVVRHGSADGVLGYGVRFVDLSRAARRRIEKFVSSRP